MSEFTHGVPGNAHDARRLAWVHPADWKNPRPTGRYNLVVIGAGAGGLITAAVAAGLGARVALVERGLLGGDCLNVGCVPSKAIIREARRAAEACSARAIGMPQVRPADVDFARVMECMRERRTQISVEDSAERYRDELGVDVFLGSARFTSGETVDVDGTSLRFRRAVIATGARAAAPPIPGLDQAGYLDNESVFDLTQRPERLAVIGAGPIGCELAQSFARLGSHVVLIEALPQILGREDPDAAQIVHRALERDGVELLVGSAIERVTGRSGGRVVQLRSSSGEARQLAVDQVLVGVGRAPNVEDMGLEAAGVEYDRKLGVRVDDHLRTANPRIFAVGDCCMQWKFTHAADAAAKIAVRNALFPFLPKQKLSALVMPWCTYTDPEVAHVGMYPKDAEAVGVELTTYQVPLEKVNRAVTDGEAEGFVKVHVRKGSDRIEGATVVCPHAGELLAPVALAMTARLGLGALLGVIFPYPTVGEALKRAAGEHARARLTPRVKRLFERWMAWSRR